jgi:DNA-binding response OmpR family regulator
VTETSQGPPLSNKKPAILHICKREMLRPLRDQILRVSGYDVDSTLSYSEGLSLFFSAAYDLVLIDVEGEHAVPEAEQLCSEIKTARHDQLVAFVCNWRVAVLTDCPDEIVRTEFNPEAFVAGVRKMLEKN